jgi:hypothetical protein
MESGGDSLQPMQLGSLLGGSPFALPLQWQLPLVYPLFSSYIFPFVYDRRESLIQLDITITRAIQTRCFKYAQGSASLFLRLDSRKHDAATGASFPNNIGEKVSGLTNDAMVGGISIFWMDPSPYFTANVDSDTFVYDLLPLSTNQW